MLEQDRERRQENALATDAEVATADNDREVDLAEDIETESEELALIAGRFDASPLASVVLDPVGGSPVAGDRTDGNYRVTDFSTLSHLIDPARFYEPGYDQALQAIIGHVLAHEAPIAETPLIQRIARAHGFQRAGGVIRDRVMQLVRQRHHVASDGTAGHLFAWPNAQAAALGTRARFPAGEEHIRQIEDISLAELRAAGSPDPIEIARRFGIRRLSASARSRIERALASG